MAIVHGYATTADLGEWNDGLTTAPDAVAERAINTASRLIDEHCGRYFWTGTAGTAKYFDRDDCGDVEFGSFGDFAVVTEVATDDTGTGVYVPWDAGDYQLHRDRGPEDDRPYVRITATGTTRRWPIPGRRPGLVRVTGTPGWGPVPTPATPPAVTDACVMLAVRRFLRRQSPEGVLAATEMGAVRVSRFDPDIAAALAPYRVGISVGIG